MAAGAQAEGGRRFEAVTREVYQRNPSFQDDLTPFMEGKARKGLIAPHYEVVYEDGTHSTARSLRKAKEYANTRAERSGERVVVNLVRESGVRERKFDTKAAGNPTPSLIPVSEKSPGWGPTFDITSWTRAAIKEAGNIRHGFVYEAPLGHVLIEFPEHVRTSYVQEDLEEARASVEGSENPGACVNPSPDGAPPDELFVRHIREDHVVARKVRGWVRSTERKLAEHRAWLRSKDYEDDGVALKMQSSIDWWKQALEMAGKSNPWPFSRKAAAPECKTRRSSLTIPQAIKSARKAGSDIGDTGLFEDWLCRAGLQTRGDPIRVRLQKAFNEGVEGGPAASEVSQHKGVAIHRTDGEYSTDLDPDSKFESVKEAKAFIGEWKKGNPGKVAMTVGLTCFTSRFGKMWHVVHPVVLPSGEEVPRERFWPGLHTRKDVEADALIAIRGAAKDQSQTLRVKFVVVERKESLEWGSIRSGNPSSSPSGKEPWQMTRAEFFQRGAEPLTAKLEHSTVTFIREIQSNLKPMRGRMVDVPSVAFIQMRTGKRLDGKYIHRKAVEQALREGLPVSPEVLADYPDLRTGNPYPDLSKRGEPIAVVRDVVNRMLADGLVTDDGARTVQMMIRRLSMSESEAFDIVNEAVERGTPASGKAISDVLKSRLGDLPGRNEVAKEIAEYRLEHMADDFKPGGKYYKGRGNPKPTLKKLTEEIRHWGAKDAQRLPTELDTLGMVDRHFGPQVVRALTQKQINVLRDAAQEAFKARGHGNPGRQRWGAEVSEADVPGHEHLVFVGTYEETEEAAEVLRAASYQVRVIPVLPSRFVHGGWNSKWWERRATGGKLLPLLHPPWPNPDGNGHRLTAVLIPQREADGCSYRVAPIQGPTGPIQVEGAFPSRAQAERTVMAQVRDALRNVHGKYQVQFQGAS